MVICVCTFKGQFKVFTNSWQQENLPPISSEIHNFRVKIKFPLAAYFEAFVATSKPIKNPVNLRYLLANDSANSPSFSLVKNYALSVAWTSKNSCQPHFLVQA